MLSKDRSREIRHEVSEALRREWDAQISAVPRVVMPDLPRTPQPDARLGSRRKRERRKANV